MAKFILFDLGETLESDGVLRPGAIDALEGIKTLDVEQSTVLLGLASDYEMPTEPSQIPIIQKRYYKLLDQLGIRSFFEPVSERVTLSTEVGAFKPDQQIFRAALEKTRSGLEFKDILFVTENTDHVFAAREMGMSAVHVRSLNQAHGEIDTLIDLVPIVEAFVRDNDPVQTVLLQAEVGVRDPILSRAAQMEFRWTLLGDLLVMRGPASHLDQIVGTGVEAARVRRSFIPESRLHVVTQVGRTFQAAHPDVPVIVDKGRYLVVDLDPDSPTIPATPDAVCYAIRPLLADAVVFDQRPHGAAPETAELRKIPTVELSRASFEEDLAALVELPTRHSASLEFLTALERAAARFVECGYATRVQTVALGQASTRNLIAERPGEGHDRGVVIVTAHLDSVNRQGAGALAPGADDNASGAAGLIALGRGFANSRSSNDLRLVLFGGEEQGLFGSRHYVAGLDRSERDRIIAVVNMDMIACRNTDHASVLLEGAQLSLPVIDALASIAEVHTALAVQTSLNPFNSDHVPFLDQGIPAVLTIEGTDSANDRVHTERDTLATLDIDLAMEILRMNAMFVASSLNSDFLPTGAIIEGG